MQTVTFGLARIQRLRVGWSPLFTALMVAIFLNTSTTLESIASERAREKRPNVIVILADDVGYADVSCQGAKHARTPHIDRLAVAGCRFTDAHAPASTCTPTRRALLTGTYSWRQLAGSRVAPGDAPLLIAPGTTTLATIMKSAGYRTGVVGKWHLGLGPETGADWNGEIKPGPLEIGFDEAFIMPATGDRVPTVYVENHRVRNLDPNDPIRVNYAEPVGNEPTGRANPELLKLKHTHGHDFTIVNGVGRIGWMSGGKSARWIDEEMSDTFAAEAVKFIEKHREQPFFLYLATHGIHVPRVPHPRFNGTSPVGTRGDAIHELDDAVGQVLTALDRLNLADDTLVIFTSDNGGVMDDGYEDTGSFDYQPNAPLRGSKGTLFEGGHRVPFLARWPGKIRPASVSPAFITHLDLPATLAKAVDVSIPSGQCLDSQNLLAALTGESTTGRSQFVFHNGGVTGPFAVRDGDWKFMTAVRLTPPPANAPVRKTLPPKVPTAPQLFNLATDPSEEHNLTETQPEKVAALKQVMERIRAAGPLPQ